MFVIAGVLQAQAQDFFPAPRDFIVDRACNATRAIRSQADPVPLDAGKTYSARGVNRSGNPTHAFIRVGEANKWVELGCGHFADGASPAPGTVSDASSGCDRKCLPFFDEVDNPESVGFGGKADITPKPPSLDSLDKAIMGVCGKPGPRSHPRGKCSRLLRPTDASKEKLFALHEMLGFSRSGAVGAPA